jgi:hypothetical protein
MPKELIRTCCVCKRTEHKGEWGQHPHHSNAEKDGVATHGYCEPCYKDKLHEMYLDLHNEKITPNHKYDI